MEYEKIPLGAGESKEVEDVVETKQLAISSRFGVVRAPETWELGS